MSRLLLPRITTERFKFPLSEEEVYRCFLAAVKGEVQNRNLEFNFNKYVKFQVETVARWLTENQTRFGLLLCGGVGTGKTTFIKAFQQLLNHTDIQSERFRNNWKIRIVDAMTIAELGTSEPQELEKLSNLPMLAIDDLGTESVETQHFGNIKTPMIRLLSIRYERQLFTMVTTNLTPQQLRSKYGERIASRFSEMMDRVVFENPSYRGVGE